MGVRAGFAVNLCCFNRYMVECELSKSTQLDNVHLCFNRYMVECEFVSDKKGLQVTIGFNRYMVECESR